MLNWKYLIPTATPTLQVMMKAANQRVYTRAGFKPIWPNFSKWVPTIRGRLASADRVNVWSLLHILRELKALLKYEVIIETLFTLLRIHY